jgi:hypothetical protein
MNVSVASGRREESLPSLVNAFGSRKIAISSRSARHLQKDGRFLSNAGALPCAFY